MTPQEQIADLQRQQALAVQQNNSQMYTQSGEDAYRASSAQRNAQIMALSNAMMQANGGGAATGPAAEMAANRDRIYANTEGRATALGSDPNFQTSMDFLRGVVGGQKTPYNDQVVSSMNAQNARGTASAESAQMEALRNAMGANGGSIYDPGYAAAQGQAMSQRQGQNLDFAGQLNSRANLENFRAQSGAANQMAGINANQNSQINQMLLAGSGYRAMENRSVPQGTMGQTMIGGQIGGTTQAPQQGLGGYQQVPQRYTAPNDGYTAPTASAPRPAPAPTSGFQQPNQTQFGGFQTTTQQQQPQTNPYLPYGQPVAGTYQPQTGIYPPRTY